MKNSTMPMKQTKTVLRFVFSLATLLVLSFQFAQAQTPNQNIPYSFQFYQKLNKSVYDVNSRFHSSIKGYYSDDTTLTNQFKSLMQLGIDTLNRRSWVRRKLTDEHLVNFTGDDFVRVFPNPVSDLLSIESDDIQNISKVEVLNLSGDVVKSVEAKDIRKGLSVKSIPAAVYIVRITLSDGQKRAKTIVITK